LPEPLLYKEGVPAIKAEISHPDKVLFPDDGVTKGDLAAHYERVAPYMLPHVKNRPVSMQRFPDGIDKQGFFQKEVPDYFPDWIERVKVPKRGGTNTQVVANDADTLVYLVNQGCITPHVWLSRVGKLDSPDRLVFDLDPSGVSFAGIRRAARQVGELVEELGLSPFAMVTGSRGIHVWVPLRPSGDFDEVREFARAASELLVRRDPDLLTLEARKQKRGERILIDIMRNGYAQTAVPPYAVRPRAGAPVATPLRWEELSDARLKPDKFTTRNIARRLAQVGDPWRGISRHARGLERPRRRLERLLGRS
jgi:bifunctional non-homologous end joining protein LigD